MGNRPLSYTDPSGYQSKQCGGLTKCQLVAPVRSARVSTAWENPAAQGVDVWVWNGLPTVMAQGMKPPPPPPLLTQGQGSIGEPSLRLPGAEAGAGGSAASALEEVVVNAKTPQGKMSCPRVSAGTIRSALPSKGMWQPVKDGFSSYVKGVGWGVTALASRAGVLGDVAKEEAIETNGRLGEAWGQIKAHPGQTALAVGAAVRSIPCNLHLAWVRVSRLALSLHCTPASQRLE